MDKKGEHTTPHDLLAVGSRTSGLLFLQDNTDVAKCFRRFVFLGIRYVPFREFHDVYRIDRALFRIKNSNAVFTGLAHSAHAVGAELYSYARDKITVGIRNDHAVNAFVIGNCLSPPVNCNFLTFQK